MTAQSGKFKQVTNTKKVDGKFIETTQTTIELDEQTLQDRKMQMIGRQNMLKRQIETFKTEYDTLTTSIAECDTMLSEFAQITDTVSEILN
jgi:hypothetical protein